MQKAKIGSAEFDPFTRVVLCPEGRESRLRPQAATLLEKLLEQSGTVQTKAVLLDAVWGNIIVTDDSLKHCVADIRKALGASRVYLQTIPRVGYRLSNCELDSTSQPGEHDHASIRNTIRYAKSDDGVRLAWTCSGKGLPLLKAPSWISNIEMENRSKIFSPLYSRLTKRTRLVRFDQRGTSLSD